MSQGVDRVQNLIKISENEERKIENRLIAIENDIGGIYKALKKYNDTLNH